MATWTTAYTLGGDPCLTAVGVNASAQHDMPSYVAPLAHQDKVIKAGSAPGHVVGFEVAMPPAVNANAAVAIPNEVAQDVHALAVLAVVARFTGAITEAQAIPARLMAPYANWLIASRAGDHRTPGAWANAESVARCARARAKTALAKQVLRLLDRLPAPLADNFMERYGHWSLI